MSSKMQHMVSLDKERQYTITQTNMRAISWMENATVMEYTNTQTETDMKANGPRISDMAKVK